MAAKNKLLERITTNDDLYSGAAVIRNLPVRVVDVLQMLAKGISPAQILQEHPTLEPDDITACLLYNSGAK